MVCLSVIEKPRREDLEPLGLSSSREKETYVNIWLRIKLLLFNAAESSLFHLINMDKLSINYAIIRFRNKIFRKISEAKCEI
jgi:hypothetical protein